MNSRHEESTIGRKRSWAEAIEAQPGMEEDETRAARPNSVFLARMLQVIDPSKSKVDQGLNSEPHSSDTYTSCCRGTRGETNGK